jgi:glycerophosphoryl diester phosphodiesterase
MQFLIVFLGVMACFGHNLRAEEERGTHPIVIAHRGASGYLPEHTLEAKVASYLMHADFIEQDVVLTRDNQPLVLHDIYLDEVTNVAQIFPDRKRSDQRYYAIDFTLDEIKKLRATERFHHENSSDQFFPNRFTVWQSSFQLNSLEEEIQLIQGFEQTLKRIYGMYDGGKKQVHKAGIYVEIKNPEFHYEEKRANFSEIVLEILSKYNYKTQHDKCIIQCFDPKELRRIREQLGCKLRLVQLLENNQIIDGFDWTSNEGLKRIKEFADGIGPEKNQLVDYNPSSNTILASEMYNQAKGLGLFIHPYTFRVDKLPDYASNYRALLDIFFKNMHVDGLFTDFTDLTLDYVKELSNDRDQDNIKNYAPVSFKNQKNKISASLFLLCIAFFNLYLG